MKKHFQKYGVIYQIILIAICVILSCLFVYLGTKNRKQYRYSEEEAINLMKLQADKFTRMVEIGSTEGSCIDSDPVTLTEEEMETYGFDKDFYESVVYTMNCENEKQIMVISITGTKEFNGYQLIDYTSNQNGNS